MINKFHTRYCSICYRSSRPEVFCKKGVLRNYAKFKGKHLWQSLFFNKVAGEVCDYIKKETLAQVFSCEYFQIFKNAFFYETPPVAPSVVRRNTKHKKEENTRIERRDIWKKSERNRMSCFNIYILYSCVCFSAEHRRSR